MEIIQNNYDKKTACGHCGSIFAYNESDIKDAYMADEMREEENAKWDRTIANNPDWTYAERLEWVGKIVRCPLCGTIMVIRHPHIYLKHKSI